MHEYPKEEGVIEIRKCPICGCEHPDEDFVK